MMPLDSKGVNMKSWFNSSELAGLPGLPSSSRAILLKAKRENWKWRKHKGLGGGKDFHYTALPDEARAALIAESVGTKKTASIPRKASTPLNKQDLAHAVRELNRIQEKQGTLLEEGKRILTAILCTLDVKS